MSNETKSRIIAYSRLDSKVGRSSNFDFLTLGPVPGDEEATQLGAVADHRSMKLECQALINQLVRVFGEPPICCEYVIVRNDHDFGEYYEVGITFNPEIEECIEFAYNVDEHLPGQWDDLAIRELTHNEHPAFYTRITA